MIESSLYYFFPLPLISEIVVVTLLISASFCFSFPTDRARFIDTSFPNVVFGAVYGQWLVVIGQGQVVGVGVVTASCVMGRYLIKKNKRAIRFSFFSSVFMIYPVASFVTEKKKR